MEVCGRIFRVTIILSDDWDDGMTLDVAGLMMKHEKKNSRSMIYSIEGKKIEENMQLESNCSTNLYVKEKELMHILSYDRLKSNRRTGRSR